MPPFDPDVFMNQTVDQPMDTTVQQCPEGEFRAMIDDFDSSAFRSFEGKEGSKNPGKSYTVFEPPFVIQDAAVQAELQRDKVVVRHVGMFLDFGQDGNLDYSKGKNVDLGRLRDAVEQNKPGAWSPKQLKGAGPVMVRVIHQEDPKNKERKYARVSRVTKIG